MLEATKSFLIVNPLENYFEVKYKFLFKSKNVVVTRKQNCYDANIYVALLNHFKYPLSVFTLICNNCKLQ